MSRFTGTDAANLKEAYASMYKQADEPVIILTEEGDYITEEFLNEQADQFVAKLIEEDYNFEEHTLEELTEKFLDEWAQNLGARIRGGLDRAAGAVGSAVSGATQRVGRAVGGPVNRAKDRIGAGAQGLVGKRTTSTDPLARGANLVGRIATSGARATGDFARGLVTGKPGASGPQKNIGTDIGGAIKKVGGAVSKASGGAAGAGTAAGAGAGTAAGAAAKPADDGGKAAWLKKTRNSPAARSGAFSDDERWALQQKHRASKAAKSAPAPAGKVDGAAGGATATQAKPVQSNPARPVGGQGNKSRYSGGVRRQPVAAEFEWENQDFLEQLGVEIFTTIATSMIVEGHTTQDAVKFIEEHDNFDIVEKALSFYDETVILENIISEEFINEQQEQLDEAIGALLRVGGALLKGARFAKAAKGAAPLARLGGALKGGGTAISRIASQGVGKSSVVRAGLAKGATSAKSLVSKAKPALSSAWGKVPTGVKKALGYGAAAYGGAKLAGAGGKKGDTYNITINQPKDKKAETPGQGKETTPPKAPEAPKPKKLPTLNPNTSLGQTHDGSDPSKNVQTKRSSIKDQLKDIKDMQAASKERQKGKNVISKRPPGAVSGSGTKEDPWITPARKATTSWTKPASTKKEAFDIVLDHLVSTKQVETTDEAIYVMSEMDSDTIQAIVKENN